MYQLAHLPSSSFQSNPGTNAGPVLTKLRTGPQGASLSGSGTAVYASSFKAPSFACPSKPLLNQMVLEGCGSTLKVSLTQQEYCFFFSNFIAVPTSISDL